MNKYTHNHFWSEQRTNLNTVQAKTAEISIQIFYTIFSQNVHLVRNSRHCILDWHIIR